MIFNIRVESWCKVSHSLSKIPKLECTVYDNDLKKKKSWTYFEKEGIREKMFFI